jgi:hypothetical protein
MNTHDVITCSHKVECNESVKAGINVRTVRYLHGDFCTTWFRSSMQLSYMHIYAHKMKYFKLCSGSGISWYLHLAVCLPVVI